MSENISAPTHDTRRELIIATQQEVKRILEAEYPDYIDFEDGSFALTHGSTQVMIIVRSFTAEQACVECTAHVVTGANITPELTNYLLRKTAELHYGGFGLLFDGTIIYSSTFSASCLDRGELQTTLSTVATIGDYYDDIIITLFGGKRASDSAEDYRA